MKAKQDTHYNPMRQKQIQLQQVYPQKSQSSFQMTNPMSKNKPDQKSKNKPDQKSKNKPDQKSKNKQDQISKNKQDQISKTLTTISDNIIPNYERKKILSNEITTLSTNVLMLTQMINNANAQKKDLIETYKNVLRGIQSIFRKINNEDLYRTKEHLF